MLGWKQTKFGLFKKGKNNYISIASNFMILKKDGISSYYINAKDILNKVIQDD